MRSRQRDSDHTNKQKRGREGGWGGGVKMVESGRHSFVTSSSLLFFFYFPLKTSFQEQINGPSRVFLSITLKAKTGRRTGSNTALELLQ